MRGSGPGFFPVDGFSGRRRIGSARAFVFSEQEFPREGSWRGRGVDSFWRCFTISNKELQINEQIRDKEVRVIDLDGSQLGIMSTADAMKKAIEHNVDLVKIAPQAVPPVCRIMDYGKYRFEQAKREKEARKKQKTIEVKEVRLSMGIDTHDFDTKVRSALRFLQDGNKVKVSVRFRGREMAHTELGAALLERFAQSCSEMGTLDKKPAMEGRSMVLFLSAKPAK